MTDTVLACVSCGESDARLLSLIGDDFWCLQCRIAGEDPYRWLGRRLVEGLCRSENDCAVERIEMSDSHEIADGTKPFVTLNVEARLIEAKSLLYKPKRAILSESIALPQFSILHRTLEEMVFAFEDIVNAMLMLQQLKMIECMVCGKHVHIDDAGGPFLNGLACITCYEEKN